MAITRVSQFLTSDNKSFDNARAANAHEAQIELQNLVGADQLKELLSKYKLTPARTPRKTPEEKAAIAAEIAQAKALKQKERDEKAAVKAKEAAAAVANAKSAAKASNGQRAI